MILSCLARERNSLQVHHLKGRGMYRTVSQLEDPSVPYSCLLCWSTASCRALSNLAVSFLQGPSPARSTEAPSGSLHPSATSSW